MNSGLRRAVSGDDESVLLLSSKLDEFFDSIREWYSPLAYDGAITPISGAIGALGFVLAGPAALVNNG